MYVVKDLVPDMNNFYKQYASIQPYLQTKGNKPLGKEQHLQSINDRKKLVSIFCFFLFVNRACFVCISV